MTETRAHTQAHKELAAKTLRLLRRAEQVTTRFVLAMFGWVIRSRIPSSCSSEVRQLSLLLALARLMARFSATLASADG